MKRTLAAVFALIAIPVAGCTPMQVDLATQCAISLHAANASNIADLLRAAQATPACMALGMDGMQRAVLAAKVKRGIE